MIGYLIKKIVGSKNDREVKKFRGIVDRINELEAALQSQPEDALRQKTAAWKVELSQITDKEPANTAKLLRTWMTNEDR